MYGPFCSMPPVATIAVSTPFFMASRISIHVRSSMKTELTASIGRGEFGSGATGSGRAAKTTREETTTAQARNMGHLVGRQNSEWKTQKTCILHSVSEF